MLLTLWNLSYPQSVQTFEEFGDMEAGEPGLPSRPKNTNAPLATLTSGTKSAFQKREGTTLSGVVGSLWTLL